MPDTLVLDVARNAAIGVLFGVPIEETRGLAAGQIVHSSNASGLAATTDRIWLGAYTTPGMALARFRVLLDLHNLVVETKRRLFGDAP